MVKELERMTRAYFEDDGATHLDFVAAWQGDGKTLIKLGLDIGKATGYAGEIQATMIRKYLKETYGSDKAMSTLRDARMDGAHTMVEQNAEDTDVPVYKDFAAGAKLKVDTRFAIAKVWNRADFSEQKNLNIAVSSTTLHIDSLRRRQLARAQVVSQQQDGRDGIASARESDEMLSAIASAIVEEADVLSIEAPTTYEAD